MADKGGIGLTPLVVVNIEDPDETITNALTQIQSDINIVKADVADVEERTDNLPNDPTSQALTDAEFTTIKNKTNTITSDPALQTTTLLIKGETDKITAVKAKTDLIISNPSTSTALAAVKAVVDAIKLLTDNLPIDTNTLLTAMDAKLDSALATLEIINDHLHPASTFIYPATGVITLTKAIGVNAPYTTKTEVVPANAIAAPFDLHFLTISGISANGSYRIALFTGAPGSEVEEPFIFEAVRSSVQSQEGRQSIVTRRFPANTRISFALSGNMNNAESVSLVIKGHPY